MGPLELPTGAWYVADPGTEPPANAVNADGFADTWPAGWERVTRTPHPRVAIEVLHGNCWMYTSHPLRGLSRTVPKMLGWECLCGCERLLAENVIQVRRLEIQCLRGPSGQQWMFYTAVTMRDCGRIPAVKR